MNIKDSEVPCTHCHLEFPEDIQIKDGENYFCCKGCQGVYHLIHDKELDSYYSKVGNRELAPPQKSLLTSETFDGEIFQKQYIKTGLKGFSEISLIIEGIHCSACIWLNEQILYETDGIIQANINFSTNRAKIVFDQNQIKLSTIIETIRSIGYDAVPFEITEKKERLDRERKDYYIRLSVGIFSVMNIMWISIALYAGYFSGIEQNVKTILNIAEWILSTPVLFYSGSIFFKGAYFGIKNRVVNMDILVASGGLLIYLYSIYITIFELGDAYFDSVAMIITFILIGKFLELLSKRGISESLDLIGKYQPREVEKVGGQKVAVENLKIGDLILVRSGERVGVDGKIIKGSGTVDESTITGENLPILKYENDKVLSGTLLIDGYLEIKVLKDFKNSHIARLVSLLEDAMNKKPDIENMANRLSGVFSTVILTLSILTFLVWSFFGDEISFAFITAVSVLIIACPCALALATPIATLVGLNIGTKKGILFKEAKFLETMAKADILAIDKTGTITEGKPKVISFQKFANFSENRLFTLLKTSKHPISKGVLEYLGEKSLLEISDFKTIPAQGLIANIEEVKVLGGNQKLLLENGVSVIEKDRVSQFYYVENGVVKALFELEDTLRKDAKDGIQKIKDLGINITILSGDSKKSVLQISDEVGIKSWKSDMKPQDKLIWIKEKQKAGKVVVMVGDGVNDILALASADIGIAMGSGTDIAMEVGDVVLQKDSIISLFESFKISKRTFSLIKQNLGISLIYNSLTIPIAMAGYVIPLIASISMSFSSILVVLNSIRVKR